MRRKNLILGAAAGIGLTAAGLSAAAVATSDTATWGRPVASVIHLPGAVFAPPPADAAPALTARQAVRKAYHLPPGKPIRAGAKVWLGLWTLPVGPASVCNEPSANCSSLTIKDGIAYTWRNKLVYGVESSACPGGSLTPARTCAAWDFIDANTGRDLGGIRPPLGVI